MKHGNCRGHSKGVGVFCVLKNLLAGGFTVHSVFGCAPVNGDECCVKRTQKRRFRCPAL